MTSIALAQINPTVGAIDDNAAKIKSLIANTHADVIVFPELALTGYSPEDLLYRPEFIDRCEAAIQDIFEAMPADRVAIIGAPHQIDKHLFNSAYVLQQGKKIGVYHKHFLPNRSVFDEYRYFTPGDDWLSFKIKDKTIGVFICEDLWRDECLEAIQSLSIDALISLNASPFVIRKNEMRLSTLTHFAKTLKKPIYYCNMIGGQDDLVFDGGSLVINETGEVADQAPFFEEYTLINTIPPKNRTTGNSLSKIERMFQAILLGTKDYVEKNGFPGVIVGNSGGIDSAVTLALAVEALGPDRVRSVMMPTQYTADMSLEDAALLAERLGIQHDIVPIDNLYEQFKTSLAPLFKNGKRDATEENIQARTRAIILMALSNKSGWMLLTTGNRSEMAVGYATLYGDMAGGYSLLKDVLKTDVYALAEAINAEQEVIPARILEREPSAELSHNQKDQDTLPDYPTLDKIITMSVEEDCSLEEIAAEGIDANTVKKVLDMIHRNEYKRRQSAPGVRLNFRAFCKDRRYPITNHFVE